jgi:hypothetical protein
MLIKLKDNERGVISLEACVLVPFFIFLMLFFYGIIIMFMGQHMVSHSLIQSAESLSLDSYAAERLSLNDIQDGGDLLTALYAGLFTSGDEYFSSNDKWYSSGSASTEETIKKRFIGYLSGGDVGKANDILDNIGIKGGVDSIDFSGCSVVDGVLTITITYKQEFLFNFQGLASFDRTMTVTSNMWGLQ